MWIEPPPMTGPRHAWRIGMLARTLLEGLEETRSEARQAGGAEGRAASDSRGEVLLDAGCGSGSLSLRLAADSELDVIGFDLEMASVRLARERARRTGLDGRLHLFVADAEAIPLADDGLDGAGCGEVLEHVVDDAAAVRELARVLRPGGVLAVTVPAGPERLDEFDRAWGHLRRYGRDQLELLVQGAGFDVSVLRGWGWLIARLYEWAVQRPVLRGAQRGNLDSGDWQEHGHRRRLVSAIMAAFALEDSLARILDGQSSGWLLRGRRKLR